MYTRETTVVNAAGLHARPAAQLVTKARTFESEVTIRRQEGGNTVNAKSLMRLLAEGITSGTRVVIAAEGPDEESAVKELAALIEEGLGEDAPPLTE